MELTGELKKNRDEPSAFDKTKDKHNEDETLLNMDELDSIAGGVNEKQRTVKNPVPMPPYTPRF